MKKITILFLFLFTAFTKFNAQVYAPLATTGYTLDAIAENTTAVSTTGSAIDGSDYVMYSAAYGALVGSTYGLPNSGIISSASKTFQLQSYTGPNLLYIPGNLQDSLTLTNATSCYSISLLGFATEGAGTASITVRFTDNTTQVLTGIAINDWFNLVPVPFYQGFDRAGRGSGLPGLVGGVSGNPRMFVNDLAIPCANQSKLIKRIIIKNTSTARLCILAVAGIVTPLTAVANPLSLCNSGTATLTAGGGASSFTWQPVGTFAGSNATVVNVSPTITTVYTVQTTSPSNCLLSALATVSVAGALPTLTVANTSPGGGVCPTKTVMLTAIGANSYTWTGPNSVTNGVVFSITSGGVYTVNGTNACGTNSATTSVSVHPLPTVGAVASSASLCSGSSLTLTTTGNASTYTWTGGYTSGTGFVPSATSIYSVVGTSALTCTALATVPVTVVNTPTAFPVATPIVVCLGNSSTLTASGATNYTWTSSSQTVFTSSLLVTPTSSGVTTYTVTKANGVCVDTKMISLITNDLPTVLVLATPTLVCATNPSSLAAAGGQTYTWTASAPANYTFTGASPVVYPAVNTTYTVAAYDGTCINTAVVSVSTNPLPSLTITATPVSGSICAGQQISLTASGGVNYTWTTVNTTSTGATVTDSPTAAIVYNLTGDNIYNCTSTAQQVMLVFPNPTVNISITKNPMVCTGGQSTVSASGANSYTWDANAGGVNTNTAAVTSTNSTSGPVVYTVTGSYNTTGCSSSKTIAISVFIPTLTVTGNTNTCDGGNVTLSAGGGNTYSWTTAPGNPPYTFPTITASLNAPTVFTLAGNTTTSGISCPSSMTIGLGIYYNPTITATAARTLVCKGENVDLMADGGVSYVWSNSQPGGTINVTPTNISTYTVTGTDANGCTSTGTVLVRYSGCNGINELNAQNNFVSIYPNPNNGQFVVKASSDLNLTISNELGQAVRFLQLSGANEHKVSIDGLAQGIYFVIGDGISQKIVVTR